MSQEIDISPLRRDKGSHQVLRLVHSGTRSRSSCADLCGLIYAKYWYFVPHQTIVNMENQPRTFDGNNKHYVSFFRQVEATVASLQFKTGTGRNKRIIDVLGILLLGVHVKTIPSQDSDYDDIDIDTLISSTEQAGEQIPERVKNVLRATFEHLDDEEVFYSAQKEVLNAILKLINPKLPEVLNFQINDIFVASRLMWKLHRKFLSYVQKNIASINDDILVHIKKFKQLSHSKSDIAAYFAELHQLFSMSASTQGRFDESFLVKQVLNEVAKDERVGLMILAARLQENSDCNLEDLETHTSDKNIGPSGDDCFSS